MANLLPGLDWEERRRRRSNLRRLPADMRFHGWSRLERSSLSPRRTGASAVEHRENRDEYDECARAPGDAESLHFFLRTESPETSPSNVREPSVEDATHYPFSSAIVRIACRGSWDCLASKATIRLKKAHKLARELSHQPVFSLPVLSEGTGAPGDAWQSATQGSRCRIRDRPRAQSRLPQNRLPFRTRPRAYFRSRFTTSSEAAPCRCRSCASA